MGFFDCLFGIPAKKGLGTLRSETQENIRRDWETISLLLKQKGPSQLRQALIIADKSLDNALKDLVIGESMGERLKNSKEMFDRRVYNLLWEAHKLRNNVVHESNFDLPYFMVTEAVSSLKEGLINLGMKV